MRRVGIRDFRDHATQYLSGDEVLAIERHGQPIGFYIPTAKTRAESFREALERLENTIQQITEETGLTEDELSNLFDLNQPLAQPSERSHSSDQHAPRR